MSANLQDLKTTQLQKIKDRKATIGIIGLGYVGLPLVLEFHRAGFPVIGFDTDEQKIQKLANGESYILHIPSQEIAEMVASGRYRGTSSKELIAQCDAVIMCVPTPLTHHREPDISYVQNTCEAIAPYIKPGQLISLESTTYPGTTEELVIPTLQAGSKVDVAKELFIAYSPEREDPSNKQFKTATIPKVVGAQGSEALEVALAIYDSVVKQTVPVSSCRVAEATKLVENIFRSVNIAMVNELKMLFTRMDIDVWEVIEAAKTKPFGFMPFYPGPGLGGHCIPIDPFYLTWKAREFEMQTKFIELSGEINAHMPDFVISRVSEALNEVGKPIRGSEILLIGLAYKANVDDQRESPSFKLIKSLEARGAKVSYHDPHIPAIKPNREYPELTGRASVPLNAAKNADLVLISTAHEAVDYESLGDIASLIVDTRNAMAKVKNPKAKIWKA